MYSRTMCCTQHVLESNEVFNHCNMTSTSERISVLRFVRFDHTRVVARDSERQEARERERPKEKARERKRKRLSRREKEKAKEKESSLGCTDN